MTNSTWQGIRLRASILNGTMPHAAVASVCLGTLRHFLSNLSIWVLPNHASCPTSTFPSPMVLRPNSCLKLILQSSLMITVNTAFGLLLDLYFTIPKGYKTSSWWRSVPSAPNKHMLPLPQNKRLTSYLITLIPILLMASNINLVI